MSENPAKEPQTSEKQKQFESGTKFRIGTEKQVLNVTSFNLPQVV